MDTGLEGKRILVTGAAGFIGSRLVSALLRNGAEVVALVDETASLSRIESLMADSSLLVTRWSGRCSSVSAGEVGRWGDIDCLVHLEVRIPKSHDFCEQVTEDINLNLLATLDLLKTLRNVGSICFASSVSVYGRTDHMTLREEDSPAPLSSYGVVKLAMESLLRAYGAAKRVPVTVLRYATVYGPGEFGHRAVPNFLNRLSEGQPPTIYGDGSEIRDYVYIDDVVDATIKALAKRPTGVFNIGSGQGHSTLDVARHVIRLYPANLAPTHLPAHDFGTSLVCDISMARETLGYSPRVGLEDGLTREIEWFKDTRKALLKA